MRRRFEGWNKWNCSADSDILCRCQTERQTDRRGRQTVCIMMMHTHTHTHTHQRVRIFGRMHAGACVRFSKSHHKTRQHQERVCTTTLHSCHHLPHQSRHH